LGTSPFHQRLRCVGGIHEHADARLAIPDEVAEVAVAADAELFEDEAHGRLIT
jgi:hypothetical protein